VKTKNMNNKQLQKRMIRHGELLMIPVTELPEKTEQVFEGKEYIVAHSETGHHHVAVGNVTVFKPIGADSADIYLRANKDSIIEHRKSFDKHQTLTIHEGLYLCRPKVEYDPFAKLIRQVRD
jgi:hypothetical protein